MTTKDEEKPPFERLGDYEVLAPISEGGMASVWLGRSRTHREQLVALKVIRQEHGRNKDFVSMFVDEVGIASRLSHPNIVFIRGMGKEGSQHFLAMELLRGHPLVDVWKAAHAHGTRLPFDVLAWMGARIADALHYAHELTDETGAPMHVVHRDVNPANIFVTRDGVPKLIDFGLAKARDRLASTAIGVVKGKLAYLSPEQALGHPADRRADIFALGITLWETTLDRRLFLDETDVETVRRVREAEVPDPTTLLDGYPRPLADVISRALARDPIDRFQTAAALRDALDAFVNGAVDAARVRALLAELFSDEVPATWERIADENASDAERTRVWEPTETAPLPVPSSPTPSAPLQGHRPPSGRLWAIAGGCAFLGALVVGLTVRGCGRATPHESLDQRVAHIEELLGLGDAGAPPPALVPVPGGTATPVDGRGAPCALAKIAGYEAWQEAFTKAKANANAAEAACGEIRNERRKQGCYYAAMSSVRATQTARDTLILGGAAARDALKNVKDDAKNDALARARTASEAAFTACGDDGGV